MRTRETILVLGGIIALMSFVVIMFDYYVRTQETQVLKKNLYYDSIIISEQKQLKEKDSLILKNQKLIIDMVNSHSNQIHTIKGKVKNLEKEEIK